MSFQNLCLMMFFVVFISCKTAKNSNSKLNNSKTEKAVSSKTIIYGFGGGVTGQVVTYKILPNGDYTADSSRDTLDAKVIKNIGVANYNKLVSKIEALKLKDNPLFIPGNMYYFLGYEEQGAEIKAVWGKEGETVPNEILNLYNELNGSSH